MKQMNLYLLSQNVNTGYDTYDSCVVCAKNEDEARTLGPDHCWCDPCDVKVKLIGVADKGIVKGIVLSSFNAG
jgi:hypothetical protein